MVRQPGIQVWGFDPDALLLFTRAIIAEAPDEFSFGVYSRATRIRTWKMTESESVALPFGDSPKSCSL